MLLRKTNTKFNYQEYIAKLDVSQHTLYTGYRYIITSQKQRSFLIGKDVSVFTKLNENTIHILEKELHENKFKITGDVLYNVALYAIYMENKKYINL